MTYKEWLYIWLDDYQKPHLKARTYRNYEWAIEKHIVPKLGHYDMDELTYDVLRRFIIECEKNGICVDELSSGTVAIIVNVLKKSLKTAYETENMDRSYTGRLIGPRTLKKETECFNIEEQRRIENEVLSKFPSKKIGILITLYTGLRIGELMALRWEDVDFARRIIIVNHTTLDTYVDGKRVTVLITPKTFSSQRIIPIPEQLMRYLIMEKTESKSEFVITTRGKGTSIRSYQKLYTSMLKKLHIKHRSFHTLRHTFATRALECGMDIKTLSEIMGHKSPTITLNLYSHSLIEHKIAMMNKLGKNLNYNLPYIM